jgi:transketolase
VETVATSGRGHLGAAFSLVEILRVLYDEVLRFDPARPKWPARDRCILSKGHGCLAQYVLLAEKGFFPEAELDRFCRAGGLLGGHPEVRVPGIEVSTGSLGHGLPVGLGMALAARQDGAEHRVFVVVGDGECDEGSVWEAALHASKHGIDRLTVVVDYNKYQSYGPVAEVLPLEPLAAKWAAFGFGVAELDGHDLEALRGAFGRLPVAAGRPSALICHTLKGYGTPETVGNMDWHHKTKVAPEEKAALLASLEAEA